MAMKRWMILCIFAASIGVRAQTLPATQPTTNLSALDELSVQRELVTIVEDAATPDRFEQLVNQFTRSDRERAQGNGPIGASDPAAAQEAEPARKLDAAVAAFQGAWKEKYRADFNLRGQEATLFAKDFAHVEMGDAHLQSATAPVNSGVDTAPPTTNPTGVKIAVTTRPIGHATATIPANANAPAIVLRFVQEGGIWKLDAPAPIDRGALQETLAAHLATATADSAKWPTDPSAAARIVTRHVLAAVTDATSRGRAAN